MNLYDFLARLQRRGYKLILTVMKSLEKIQELINQSNYCLLLDFSALLELVEINMNGHY